MINQFRYWLSTVLLYWAITLIPDERAKAMVKTGLHIAANQLIEELEGYDVV